MADDLSLFGEDNPDGDVPQVHPSNPIEGWQIGLLRKSLDARGLAEMAERQRAVEAAAGRPVDSLRALTHDEAMTVLAHLGADSAPRARLGSEWEERQEDTWIDRL